MSLRDVLDALVASAPVRTRPARARTRRSSRRSTPDEDASSPASRGAGRPADGRGARALARRRSWPPTSALTSAPDGVALAAGVGGAAVRGHLPVARGRGPAGRRRRGASAARRGRSSLVAPGARRDAGLIPTLGHGPAIAARGRPRARARRPRRAARRARATPRADVVEHRGEFAVRGGVVDVFPGTARRPVRLEYWGDEIESLREFSPSTQLSTEQLGASRSPPVRELIPDDAAPRPGRRAARRGSRTGSATGCNGSPTGCSSREPTRSHRSSSTTCRRPPSCCPPARWVVLTQAHARAIARAQTHAEAEALAEAIGWPGPHGVAPLEDALGGRVQLHLTEFTEGLDLGLASWGTAAGQPRRARRARSASCAERGYRVVRHGRGHGSLERAQEVVGGPSTSSDRVARSPTASCSRQAGSPSSPRRTCSARAGTRGRRRGSRAAAPTSIAEELEPGDFAVHRIHGVGPLRGHRPPRARGRRARLPGPRVRGGRQAVRPDRPGRHGGAVPRRRRPAPASPGRQRLGARDHEGQARRARTWPASSSASTRCACRCPGTPSAPTRRGSSSSRTPSRTRRRPTSSPRSTRSRRDMEQPKPMDRLICGDVGFGKTEIAVRAAFKAVMEGKQVAVLVPTTLLAEQHFITFSERFAPVPGQGRRCSRASSRRPSRSGSLEDRAAGTVDVVIGTHRLLGQGHGVQGPRACSSSTRSSGSASRTRSG